MARDPQRRLVVPTLLAACALAAPSCEDEPSDDTTADSNAAETTISGANECFDIPEQAACESEAAFECLWNATSGQCLPNCPAYTEQAACDDDYFCVWTGDVCADGAI